MITCPVVGSKFLVVSFFYWAQSKQALEREFASAGIRFAVCRVRWEWMDCGPKLNKKARLDFNPAGLFCATGQGPGGY